MNYHCVGDLIGLSWPCLRLPITAQQALDILQPMGFVQIHPNITDIARALIGKSEYRRGARPQQAPQVVDCSSMVKWIYGQMGIWLPRYSIDQRGEGRIVAKPKEGDLIFSSGWRSYYWNNPNDGVGHVGIVTNSETVIHAASRRLGVTESRLMAFCDEKEKFRGIRRYLPQTKDFLVLQMTGRRVETSQELRWLILQRL